MHAADGRLVLKNRWRAPPRDFHTLITSSRVCSKHGSVIVTAEPMSGNRIHDLTFDVSCKDLQSKDLMGSSDPCVTCDV